MMAERARLVEPNPQPYRADIDGLRAVAVLSVVAFHAGLPGVPGGFVGVDVFFVISGYLITALLLRELLEHGRVRLVAFYARRVRRLLPALLVTVAITLLLGALLMFPQELPRLGKSAIAVVFIASNLHFLNYSGGYFDPSTDLMPLLHTWSLAVEEQYYLVWPLLLIALGWTTRRCRSLGVEVLALLALATILATSFAGSLIALDSEQAAAFYLMPLRAWEFALGGIASVGHRRIRLAPRAGGALALAGLLAIGFSVTLLEEGGRFPGTAVLWPTLGAAAAMFGLHYAGAEAPVARILGNGFMVRIGLLSYSWYLWHWPLLSLARAYSLGVRDVLRDSVIVLVALVLAALTYRFVECPIRYRKPWLFARPRGALLLGAALSLAVLIVASGVIHYGKKANARMNEQLGKLDGDPGHPFSAGKCKEPMDGRVLAPQRECVLGSSGEAISMMAWGDSHTAHLAPMLLAQAKATGGRVLVRAFGACPPVVGAVPYKKREGRFVCGHFNENAIAEAKALAAQGGRGVLLAARWNAHLALPATEPGGMASYALLTDWHRHEGKGAGEFKVGVAPLDSAGAARTMAGSLRHTLEELNAVGLRVVIVAPVPELYFSAPQCLYRRSEPECRVNRNRVDERRVLAMRVLAEAAARFDNVRVWDPIDQFCDLQWCYAARNGAVMYSDDNHLSHRMSEELLKAARPHLDWLARR